MKMKILGMAALIAISVMSVYAVSRDKASFKVAGNCGMCETRIESAALSVEGVKSAEWDKKSGMIKISYNSGTTEIDKIQLAIAEAGHDTELHKADAKVYEKLPGCCKYDRETKSGGCCPDSKAKDNCGSAKSSSCSGK